MSKWRQWFTPMRMMLILGALLVLGGGSWLIHYATSFSMVSLQFDGSLGSVQLRSASGQIIPIQPGTPVRLKKGNYTAIMSGPTAQAEQRPLTITHDREQIPITIYYNTTHLASLLEREQAAISQAINQQYPQLHNLYTITHGQLYKDGTIYGATLTYHGSNSDQRDSLRILLTKRSGQWQVRTVPPQPLLSAPLLRDIPADAITAINRGQPIPPQ